MDGCIYEWIDADAVAVWLYDVVLAMSCSFPVMLIFYHHLRLYMTIRFGSIS